MDEMYARTVSARSCELIPSARPFSNFEFIDKHFSNSWPLRRILSQVRQLEVATITKEVLFSSKDIDEENRDIRDICPLYDPNTAEVVRLGFFNKSIKSSKDIEKLTSKNFLGYAIIKHDIIPATSDLVEKDIDRYRIYESVLKIGRHDNNYIKRPPKWNCAIQCKNFDIKGHLYAQQNGVSNCCAHVAIRTAAGAILGKDISYRQINHLVNEYRTKYTKPYRSPGKGLTNNEICYVLEHIGANCFVGDYTKEQIAKPLVPYQKYIYGSIEQGFPAILFFGVEENGIVPQTSQQQYHVIPVFGHTFNEDTWVPDANIMYFPFRKKTKALSSDNWVSMFIGHDDNAGSNYCIPQTFLESIRLCPKEPHPSECSLQKSSVAYAIGTLPKRIEMDPIEAESMAAYLLPPVLEKAPKKYSPWRSRLQIYMENELLVLRPLLVTGVQYQKHLTKIIGWDKQKLSVDDINILDAFTKDDFWMVELSVPELFSANRRKVGELLLWANKKPDINKKFESFCLSRIPGCFAFFTEMQENGPSFFYRPTEIKDHVQLYDCEKEK